MNLGSHSLMDNKAQNKVMFKLFTIFHLTFFQTSVESLDFKHSIEEAAESAQKTSKKGRMLGKNV